MTAVIGYTHDARRTQAYWSIRHDTARVLRRAAAGRASDLSQRPRVTAAQPTRLQAARARTVGAADRLDDDERAPLLSGGGEGVQNPVARRSRALIRGDARALRATVQRADRGRGELRRSRVEPSRPVLLQGEARVRAASGPIPVVHPLRRDPPSRAAD